MSEGNEFCILRRSFTKCECKFGGKQVEAWGLPVGLLEAGTVGSLSPTEGLMKHFLDGFWPFTWLLHVSTITDAVVYGVWRVARAGFGFRRPSKNSPFILALL